MKHTTMTRLFFLHMIAITLAAASLRAEAQQSPQRRGGPASERGVYKLTIEPHWFAEGTKFWYRNELAEGRREFVIVDAAAGDRRAAFDHPRLAAALAEAVAAEGSDGERTFDAERLPLERLQFSSDASSVTIWLENSAYECDLTDYGCRRLDASEIATDDAAEEEGVSGRNRERRRWRQRGTPRLESPDSKWQAFVTDGNVFIRPLDVPDEEDGATDRAMQLTEDGSADAPYGQLNWSPDSQAIVAFQRHPGDDREVHLVESSPEGGGRAQLHSRPYSLPGDKLPTYQLSLFRVNGPNQLRPEVPHVVQEWGRPNIHWSQDGTRFSYRHVDRGHQRLRVTSVSVADGTAIDVVDEQTDTFIWTAHTENLQLELVNWLENSDELIYVSEQSGWRHLYLANATASQSLQPITSGEYVVRGIDRIDEEKREIWFHASGKHADQDPYFLHYYRVGFDGENLVALTSGHGNHTVQYSPDERFVIDTYSRVDQPPIHELRRTTDGQLVCRLEEADWSELLATGWKPLEPFVAKGRDDTTDIWGVICRPSDFDPTKRYPIVESVYAGPQGSYVPKSFRITPSYQAIADLGFIVVQIDGMGTANRSKAFHDVCWHNLKDGGFPDRIRWIQAAAELYPSMDLSRVGIYGTSAGGQNAAGAVLFHPDFYHVAIAACGCHDNRMDKASWNEQWMGYPVGPQYSESSNIDNAQRLGGKLLLIVGEMDNNVPPESTMRFVDALVRHDKDFDMLVIPGAGHGMGGRYGYERMQRYLLEHLKSEQLLTVEQ